MHRTVFTLSLLIMVIALFVCPSISAVEAGAVLHDSGNAFSATLYTSLAKKGGNLFFSPFSLDVALAMTSTGAAGKTLSEMQTVLGITGDADAVAKKYGELQKAISAPKGGYEIALANALWAQKGYHFLPAFLKRLETSFGAGLTMVDFVNATEASRKTINDWVDTTTKGRIKDLIPEGILNSLTKLVLTNAIWFKGTWTKAFPEEETCDSPFFRGGPGEDPVTVKMMSQSGAFKHGTTEECAVLELPYGKDAAMTIILPTQRVADLEKLEAGMTPETLTKWLAMPTLKDKVEVHLPRFKMTSKFRLKPVLQGIGMKTPFDEKDADLSGMDGSTDLVIAEVVHKAFVEVNEKGTEAAAATAVIVQTKGMSMDGPVTPLFRVDHPFLFVIRDLETHAILFMGRVTDPTAMGE